MADASLKRAADDFTDELLGTTSKRINLQVSEDDLLTEGSSYPPGTEMSLHFQIPNNLVGRLIGKSGYDAILIQYFILKVIRVSCYINCRTLYF